MRHLINPARVAGFDALDDGEGPRTFIHYIDTPLAVSEPPAQLTNYTPVEAPSYWESGNPTTGTLATTGNQDYHNAVMMELINVAIWGGLTPTKGVWTQVRDAIIAKQGGGRLLSTQILTGSGTYEPNAAANMIRVRAVGDAGAGGGVATTTSGQYAAGGGGGSGAYAEAEFTAGFQSGVAFSVGPGGTGVSNGNGNNGTGTTFGSLISCPGGKGGFAGGAVANTVVAATLGGAAADVATVTGASKVIVLAPGSSGNSGLLVPGYQVNAQSGAPGPWGGGALVSAHSGIAPGSGGGGAQNLVAAAAAAGLEGAGGIIIVDEYS